MSRAWKNDSDIKYNFFACPSFLNLWMTKLTNKDKDPGTIGTYLKLVKQFIDFVKAEESNLFKNQKSKKFGFYYLSGAAL